MKGWFSEVAPKAPSGKLFITYTKADGEFARMLDASLDAAGVVTFLYERDVQVGESIVKRVFETISSAAGLVYLISKHSASSAWADRELMAAISRQRERPHYKILPVRLDDTPAPPGIADLRHLDMRSWRDPVDYRRATLELLAVFDRPYLLIGAGQVHWWLANHGKIHALQRLVEESYHLFDAACGYWQYFDPLGHGEDNAYWAAKIVISEIGIEGVFRRLVELLSELDDPRVWAIRSEVDVLMALANRRVAGGREHSRTWWHGLEKIVANLRNLQTEVDAAVYGAVGAR